MARTLVPVHIKPHLIPFLYQHFKADEKAQINGKKVKSVIIDKRTPIGKMIRLLIEKNDKKSDCNATATFFFSIQEKEDKNDYFGAVYLSKDGRSSFLYMPEAAVRYINEWLADQLDKSLLFFLHGFHTKKGKQGLEKAINIFLERYNLFNHGFDVDAVRQKYYRWLRTIDR